MYQNEFSPLNSISYDHEPVFFGIIAVVADYVGPDMAAGKK
jgi:hypothetical protein